MAETLDAALTTDLTIDSASWWKRVDAKDDSASTNEDTPVTIDVLHNDVGALGIIKVDGKSVTADTPIKLISGATVDLDGKSLLYHPGEAFQGLNSDESEIDTFSYTVVGKGKATDTANVNIEIAGVTDPVEPGENHPPEANNDKAYLPNYYPYPLPYEEAATTADGSLSDDLIYTTLAIGEEGDPNPYPSSVNINVLDNDTDPDESDTLAVTKIDGKDVKSGDTVTLQDSLATVKLNADGSLTYTEDGKYVDIDPMPLAEQDATQTGSSDGSGELLPYPGPVLIDSFTYSASDGTLSDEAMVEVYRMSDWYVLGSEPAA